MADFGKLILSKADGLSQEFILNKSLVTLGRATTNDIVLVEGRVSRNHAQVRCTQDGITLTDLNSANGVWLNGQRISETKVPGLTATARSSCPTSIAITKIREHQIIGAAEISSADPPRPTPSSITPPTCWTSA